jgi:hypothetical protein
MIRLPVEGRIKATTSPKRREPEDKGEIVTTSPSLTKGYMLKPLARNLKGNPLLSTA